MAVCWSWRSGSAAAMLLPNMSRDRRFQLSSDLAGVLGVTAGQEIALRVTAFVMTSAGASRLSADTPAVVPAGAESAARYTVSRKQAIQVAVFAVEANAHAARARLAEAGLRAEIRRLG